MIVIDTNALARLFLDDIPDQAKLVSELFEKEKEIFIPDAVFLELDYLLIKFYKFEKKEVIDLFKNLLESSNVKFNKYINKAYLFYLMTNNSFADCIIVAQSDGHKLASFDKNILKIKGVKGYF